MGILGGIGNILSGKPVFEEPSGAPNQQPASPQPSGGKSIPRVIAEHIKCDEDGTNISCTLVIRNQSTEEVFLDKVRILNITKELDTNLRAGESREFYPTYRGPKPTHNNYTDCQLEYRTMTGDYFRTSHTVEYEYEQTGTYVPNRIRFIPPVRDI